MGAATMVVFLFHGFVQRAIDYAGFEAGAQGQPVAAPVLAVTGSVRVTSWSSRTPSGPGRTPPVAPPRASGHGNSVG